MEGFLKTGSLAEEGIRIENQLNMKISYFFYVIILFVFGCTPSGETIDPDSGNTSGNNNSSTVETKKSGEWTNENWGAGGLTVATKMSPKNFFFEFDVEKNNQSVMISTISSDINIGFDLLDTNGESVKNLIPTKSPSINEVLNIGHYILLVYAERKAVGKFQLNITGSKSGFTKKEFTTLKSNKTNWMDYGAGGDELTPRNDFYTFEVTENNSWVDFEMQSADVDISYKILNEQGTVVASEMNSRYRNTVKKLDIGKYTFMAGTKDRNAKGSYECLFHGNIKNLKKDEIVTEDFEDEIVSGVDNNTYKYEITENSYFDIDISSSDFPPVITIYDANNTKLASKNNTSFKYQYLLKYLSKGIYYIEIKRAGSLKPGGKYTIRAAGKFI